MIFYAAYTFVSRRGGIYRTEVSVLKTELELPPSLAEEVDRGSEEALGEIVRRAVGGAALMAVDHALELEADFAAPEGIYEGWCLGGMG